MQPDAKPYVPLSPVSSVKLARALNTPGGIGPEIHPGSGNSMSMQRVWAVFLVVALLSGPVSYLRASSAALGRMIPHSSAQLNGVTVYLESTVFSGDVVNTPSDSFAVFLLARGNQLQLGPASEVRLVQAEAAPVVVLERGAVLVGRGEGKPIAVQARGLLLRPQGVGRYEVAVTEKGVVVAATDSDVTVHAANQSFLVAAGKAMRFEVADGPQRPVGARADDGVAWGVILGASIAAGAAGVLLGWLIANNRAQDRCLQRVRAISPTAPESVCDF